MAKIKEEENITLYKLSIIYLDKFLKDNLITNEEYLKCKRDFKLTYGIKDNLLFI